MDVVYTQPIYLPDDFIVNDKLELLELHSRAFFILWLHKTYNFERHTTSSKVLSYTFEGN